MEKIELTCITCPLGCALSVEREGDRILSVTGNSCPRGRAYAETECLAPVRTLTTTVRVRERGLVSVKSDKPLPKGTLFACMRALASVEAQAPVVIGDVIVRDILGTGADIVATANVE